MYSEQLKTFIVLAEAKNFTQTAEQLFVAQSTVTNRIAELEKEVGRSLFNRDKKSVQLTEEGIIFLEYAKKMIHLEASSIQEINAVKKYAHLLRIGTTNIIYECFLADQIVKILQSKKDISVKIHFGLSLKMLEMLQDDVLDIVYSFIPFKKRGIESEKVAEEQLVLVTHYENNFFPQGIIKEQLTEINYLFCNFPIQEIGNTIKAYFPKYHQFSLEIDNSSKIVNYLLKGIGYSFLPQSLVEPYIKVNRLRIIKTIDFKLPKISYYRCYKTKKQQNIKELIK